MSAVTSCAFLVDGRTVVVELVDCALLVDFDGVPRDLSAVAAGVYAAGVEALVSQARSPVLDTTEVGHVRLAGEVSGCHTWVVDLAAGISLPVTPEALVSQAAAGIGRWLADAIEDSCADADSLAGPDADG